MIFKLTDKEKYQTGAQRNDASGKGAYELISPIMIRRLAQHLERHAPDHGERNWEKGMPFGRTLQSAFRHLFQYLEGYRDEDHLAAAAFNIMCLIHFEEKITDGELPGSLIDIPQRHPSQKPRLSHDNVVVAPHTRRAGYITPEPKPSTR